MEYSDNLPTVLIVRCLWTDWFLPFISRPWVYLSGWLTAMYSVFERTEFHFMTVHGCIINSRLHTPLSPLISHRCQKEACTEIKGRIWALCSKIKLSVVIFYITFRTAYWKMFPLLGLLPPLLLSLFRSPSFFLFSVFFFFVCIITHSHSLCNVLEWSLLACKVPPLTTSTCTQTSPEEQWLKSTSRLRTQHNGPRFLHKRILRICIFNVTAVFNTPLPLFEKQKSEPKHLLTAIPLSDTHPGVQSSETYTGVQYLVLSTK